MKKDPAGWGKGYDLSLAFGVLCVSDPPTL